MVGESKEFPHTKYVLVILHVCKFIQKACMADTNLRRVLWVLTIENWNPGSTVDVYESEDHSGLPFWGVSYAAHDNSFGILGIIYILTSSVSRLFSRNIGQLLSVAQKFWT